MLKYVLHSGNNDKRFDYYRRALLLRGRERGGTSRSRHLEFEHFFFLKIFSPSPEHRDSWLVGRCFFLYHWYLPLCLPLSSRRYRFDRRSVWSAAGPLTAPACNENAVINTRLPSPSNERCPYVFGTVHPSWFFSFRPSTDPRRHVISQSDNINAHRNPFAATVIGHILLLSSSHQCIEL